MKVCPVCKKTYDDENLNFCLEDGEILKKVGEDAPPTVFMNQARTTNQNWADYEPKNQWQNQPLAINQPYGVVGQNPQYAVQGQNQTLAIVSLSLGILGIVLICCWGGIPLGTGAVVTGYLAYNNVKREPAVYGGGSMAMGGMITGGISLLLGLGLIVITLISKL